MKHKLRFLVFRTKTASDPTTDPQKRFLLTKEVVSANEQTKKIRTWRDFSDVNSWFCYNLGFQDLSINNSCICQISNLPSDFEPLHHTVHSFRWRFWHGLCWRKSSKEALNFTSTDDTENQRLSRISHSSSSADLTGSVSLHLGPEVWCVCWSCCMFIFVPLLTTLSVRSSWLRAPNEQSVVSLEQREERELRLWRHGSLLDTGHV